MTLLSIFKQISTFSGTERPLAYEPHRQQVLVQGDHSWINHEGTCKHSKFEQTEIAKLFFFDNCIKEQQQLSRSHLRQCVAVRRCLPLSPVIHQRAVC